MVMGQPVDYQQVRCVNWWRALIGEQKVSVEVEGGEEMGVMDGKVVLVTGAGGGLGRAYALLLARHGAKVVVNDRGEDRRGERRGKRLADGVVQEIGELGGEAIANYDSVSEREGAKAMVDAAFAAFGRLDGVINNAGILRDKTLVRMDDEMWQAVMDVHLKGTFLVSQAAVKRMMRGRISGSIVNTSSFAGLKGNFGQTNYGAAKAGVAGFTRSLALEGERFGIRVNVIAPLAKTGMTAALAAVPDDYRAEDIAPLVVWLLSDEAAEVTGRVFGAHGRHYFEYLVETTAGVDKKGPWSVEEVGKKFGAIAAKTGSGQANNMSTVESGMREGPNSSAVGKKFIGEPREITREELIEYAQAVDESGPRYLAGEVSAPLFSVRPFYDSLHAAMYDEELSADMVRLVHGEQEMHFFDVLRPGDKVVPQAEITAVEEKSSGWLIDVTQRLHRDGELVVEARSGLFVRRPVKNEAKSQKKRPGQAVEEEEKTVLFEEEQLVAADQTERYARVSGDHNPIHLDKEAALAAGLPDVILHGLCTMAFAARAVVGGVLNEEVERLRRIKVRFARPVLPGTRLTTRVYEGSDPGILGFEMVDEAGNVVLSAGEAEFVAS